MQPDDGEQRASQFLCCREDSQMEGYDFMNHQGYSQMLGGSQLVEAKMSFDRDVWKCLLRTESELVCGGPRRDFSSHLLQCAPERLAVMEMTDILWSDGEIRNVFCRASRRSGNGRHLRRIHSLSFTWGEGLFDQIAYALRAHCAIWHRYDAMAQLKRRHDRSTCDPQRVGVLNGF